MMISTKGRYALRFIIDIAENQKDGYVALKDVSERQEISKKYLEQIIPLLCRAGFLSVMRGPHGGYRLQRSADSYTVGAILEAAEGSLLSVACLEENAVPCPRSGNCKTLPVWIGLNRVISEYLNSVTIQDLIEEKPGNDYVI